MTTPRHPQDRRLPNSRPYTGRTFLVDPGFLDMVHILPIIDGMVHMAWIAPTHTGGAYQCPCECHPLIVAMNFYTMGEQGYADVLEFYQDAHLGPSNPKDAQINIIQHRGAIARATVPKFWPPDG